MRTVNVHDCSECPAHHCWRGPGGWIRERCSIANRSIEQDDPERPEWCPLTKGPVLVQIAEGA